MATATTSTEGDGENVYQTCIAKLQSVQPIMDGFNHRNRSQHRHARWWSAFGQMRRNARKLVGELHASAARAKAASRKKSKKKRKLGDGNAGEEGEGEENEQVRQPPKRGPAELYALWLWSHEIPQAYV